MDEKGTSGFIILVYAIGLITAVLLLLLSNKLFTPLLIEVNSGKSIINLFFNKDDHFKLDCSFITTNSWNNHSGNYFLVFSKKYFSM